MWINEFAIDDKFAFCFQFRYDSINTQRQRDKQRLTDLERNLTDERQNKQRLESQIKTEKTVTKSLQDALTKLSLTPTKFVNQHYFSDGSMKMFVL